jgi:signal transduction histidine kinase
VDGVRVRVDAGLIGLAVVLGALFFVDSLTSEPLRTPAQRAADLVLGGVACALLLLRRRWPVAVAVVLMPGLLLSATTIGATAVALSAVAVYRRWPVTMAVTGLHALFVVALFALAASEAPGESAAREFWEATVVLLALDAALVASGLLVRSQRMLVQSYRDRAREAEEGQRLRVEEARHAERERIAREMHDVLAHRISLLAVHAGALELRRTATDEERRAVGVIRQSAYAALEDLREVIAMLRDDGDDRPQPTLTEVPALIEQSRRAGMEVTLEPDELPTVPEGIGRHVYRTVQEGLTNARKHAPGTPVGVRLEGADGGVSVEVTNPAPALGVTAGLPGAGSGLIGLRERMHLVGGRLEHGRTPEGEFRLHAWLPWRS